MQQGTGCVSPYGRETYGATARDLDRGNSTLAFLGLAPLSRLAFFRGPVVALGNSLLLGFGGLISFAAHGRGISRVVDWYHGGGDKQPKTLRLRRPNLLAAGKIKQLHRCGQ